MEMNNTPPQSLRSESGWKAEFENQVVPLLYGDEPEMIEAFISQALAQQRKEIREEIKSKYLEITADMKDTGWESHYQGYNEAIDEILSIPSLKENE